MHTCLAAQPNMHSIQPFRDERTGSIAALQNNTQAFTCVQTINNLHKPLSQTVISDGWKISAGILWLRLAGEQGVVYITLTRPMKAEERWQACRWLQHTIPFYHVITIKSRTPREWSYTLKEREKEIRDNGKRHLWVTGVSQWDRQTELWCSLDLQCKHTLSFHAFGDTPQA